MPTRTSIVYPRPRNWPDFEDLCRDLWSRIWDDPNAQGNGRPGQDQDGVDVFGRPRRGRDWAGVQCKLRRGSLSLEDVEEEVKRADAFNPRLSDFIVATTAPRDVKLQKAVREITQQRLDEGLFPVTVFAWEDVCLELSAHADLVAKHYPGFGLGAESEAAKNEYLGTLWARLLPVPYLAVVGTSRREIPLSAVYTALDVDAKLQLIGELSPDTPGEIGIGLLGSAEYLRQLGRRALAEARSQQEKESRRSRQDRSSYSRLCTAVEAVAAAPRLVLKGPAGSGKSTFARYLALSFAGTVLGQSEANLERLNGGPHEETPVAEDLAWPHGVLVPIFVELKSFVRSEAFPAANSTGEASHLLEFFGLESFDPESERYQPFLRESLSRRGDGCLLILDGLDETPAAETVRERLCSVISSFARRFPECRVLVTSRPYAYERGDGWRLDDAGFNEVSLAPFDDGKIRAYVESWYELLAERGQVGREQAASHAADLVHEIERTPYLQPLAERPLMLSMMANVHAAGGGRFQGGRAELYEESVKLLLDRWNERRGVTGESIGELLGMDPAHLRSTLERLAFEVHRDRGAGAEEGPAEIPDTVLWKALDEDRPRDRVVDERRVMDYLHQRSGILVAESPSLFRFPHRSYQEYLAACYLLRKEFPRQFRTAVESDPALWREVALLAAGKEGRTPHMVWSLLEALVSEDPSSEIEVDDPRFLRTLYAGLAVAENGLWQVERQYEERLERIRQWLERSLVVGALSPADRAAAGRVLGRLGDRRRGVGVGLDGVPEIDWVEIPAGPFLMGSLEEQKGLWDGTPQIEVELPSYRISRYPVTNVQYRAFVEDSGYTQAWRHCWTEAGWERKGGFPPLDDQFPREWFLDNLPRANVSWYEAHAFSRWLAHKLGHPVRLPSEAEWEKAARGEDGRAYPWGDDFDAARCNADETGLGTTSAVGMFPGGASPYGVLDLSGNVWEWCSTKWRDSYEEPADEDPEGDARRVVRGGSFGLDPQLVRCAARGDSVPDGARTFSGFRVCAPISDPPDSGSSGL
jgi:formylglycine-generating enzyme required for sulfatase activity